MVLQLIPIPIGGMAHPIWTSAATALGVPTLGRMSADPGATLLSLCRYFCVVGITIAAACVAVDRRRAELLLFSLVAAVSAIAAIFFIYSVGGYALFGATYNPGRASVMSAVNVLGTIVAAAAAIRAFERFETRSGREMTLGQFWKSFALWLAAWSMSWLVISNRSTHIFAAACGSATLAIIEFIRRLGISQKAGAILAALTIVIGIVVVAIQPTSQRDVTLRFAATATPSSNLSVAEQMLSDARWVGAGAGTFSSLAPIYRDINDPDVQTAPTTAAAIAIEFGRLALPIALAAAIAAAVLLARGALKRGRDSFYSAAGAGCVVAMTVELFVDATALATTVQILAAVMLGLGLAQSRSRNSP